MSVEKKILSDLLRDHINEKIDGKYDYKQKSSITADIKSFCEKHPVRKFEESKVRPSHYKILNECLKNKGIDPKSLGRLKQRPKFNKGLASKISAKPTETSAPMQGKGEKGQATLVKKKIKRIVYDKDGKPIGEAEVESFVSQDGTRVFHDWEHFDEAGVSATLNAFYVMIRITYPELESLSDEEKKSLGKMWLPAFKRYLSENWAYIGVPFLATMGMMLPKVAAARRLKKGESPEKKDTEKASKEEKKRHDDTIECPFCKKRMDTYQDLKVHKRTCTKKPKMSAI